MASGSDPFASLPKIAQATIGSPAELDAIVNAGEPRVVRGLVSQWPLCRAAANGSEALFDYLKSRDRGMPVPVMEAPAAAAGRFGYTADPREYSFTRRQRPLLETLNRIVQASSRPGGPVIAIQMLALADHMPQLVAENPMSLLPDTARPLLWLGGQVKTQIHHDREHNLACVVTGRRRFLLFPPGQVGNLYIGPRDRAPPLSLVDPEAPDLERYPRFATALAAASVAELGPGDALLMPRFWWHHVTSLEPINAMVNFWWGGTERTLDDPHQLFLAALLGIRNLPPSERSYWQAMFAEHVFEPSAEAISHLPDGLAAYLGPLSARDRADLRRQLLSSIIKSG